MLLDDQFYKKGQRSKPGHSNKFGMNDVYHFSKTINNMLMKTTDTWLTHKH